MALYKCYKLVKFISFMLTYVNSLIIIKTIYQLLCFNITHNYVFLIYIIHIQLGYYTLHKQTRVG